MTIRGAQYTISAVDSRRPATGTRRVIRGGYYNNTAPYLRASMRSHHPDDDASTGDGNSRGRAGIGLRCCYAP